MTRTFAPLALAAACTPVVDEPVAALSAERQCFFTSQIDGYNDAPDGRGGDRLYVDTGPRDRWLLETFGACPELDWTQSIAIDARAQISLCTGDTATVIVPNTLGGAGGIPSRCTARVLGKVLMP